MSVMNECEEDVDDFPVEKTKENRPNLRMEQLAQSRQINFQQEVEPQRRFHLSPMD